MPPQRHNKLSRVAQPTRHIFDPWNSASTGHQRSDGNPLSGSTSWRESRDRKLGYQFRSGGSGGPRIYDSMGAGSENFRRDGRLENGGWVRGASGLRAKGQRSLKEMLGGVGKVGLEDVSGKKGGGIVDAVDIERDNNSNGNGNNNNNNNNINNNNINNNKNNNNRNNNNRNNNTIPTKKEPINTQTRSTSKKIIFLGLCIYINGSTMPHISDHKLKRLLSENGATLTLSLRRKSVTHVILGMPNTKTARGGCVGAGGGLAAGKIQKEIQTAGRGGGVRVLKSIEAGKRLPESRFEALRLAGPGQRSVNEMFKREKS
ncbi:MAG: hypothetical protein M1834_008360 [Cirrosporium novae-zelandiae]|nr:MAG: hypothetical protein M1834_008360 [Cirrosporium novae-zelandiae]